MSFQVPDPKPRPANSVRLPVAMVVAAVVVLGVLVRISSSNPETICTLDHLASENGFLVRTNDGSRFSGDLVEFYAPGVLKSRRTVRNGQLEGLSESWHTNGAVEAREFFISGQPDGVRTHWYASGAKRSEATLVAGKMEGVFRAWHENGQLAEEIAMKNDRPSGEARAWYPSGYLKTAIGTNRLGRMERKHWADGECREWP